MNTTTSTVDVNFHDLMQRVLGLLTDKEQDIIERRFSIGLEKKETLDKIGKSYNITRERVRQIESVALRKLARISMDPAMQTVHDLAYDLLLENGGLMMEDLLMSEMLRRFKDQQGIDVNAMKLAMQVSERIAKQDKSQHFKAFWHIKDIAASDAKTVQKGIYETLKQNNNEAMAAADITESLSAMHDPKRVISCLHIDPKLISINDLWGLKTNRIINPKSIKDKIIITLKNEGKPMHFSEIITAVLKSFKEQRSVTPQAVHNELIRHEEFVLVGRGLYGLKKWGLVEGTVCDVIIQVLQENGEPMRRQDIINAVLQKRDIRVGTISLNLQKYDFFQRVGRAVYEYVPEMDKRRRNMKKLEKLQEKAQSSFKK